MSAKPLAGIRVVDLTIYAAGPGAARMLADWGADVIKVEPFRGDPMRDFGLKMSSPSEEGENLCWEIGNANKRSLALDLKSSEGMKVMDDLLAKADVFVTSNRTDALQRLGLDYEIMSKKHPHIVWGQINGFGDFGPDYAKPGFDTVAFWARGGAMLDITERDTFPITAPIAFGDNTASCSLAAGICAALLGKQKTGKGEKVLVSLFGQAVWSGGYIVQSTQYGDAYPKSRKEALAPLVNSFKCRDGEWVFVTVLEHARYWKAFCDTVILRPDMGIDPRYTDEKSAKENVREIIDKIDAELIKYDSKTIIERLIQADIAHNKIQHFEEVHKDPKAIENGYVYKIQNRNGSEKMAVAPPIKFGTAFSVPEHKLAPLLGENTLEILQELGYDQATIKEILDKKIAVAR